MVVARRRRATGWPVEASSSNMKAGIDVAAAAERVTTTSEIPMCWQRDRTNAAASFSSSVRQLLTSAIREPRAKGTSITSHRIVTSDIFATTRSSSSRSKVAKWMIEDAITSWRVLSSTFSNTVRRVSPLAAPPPHAPSPPAATRNLSDESLPPANAGPCASPGGSSGPLAAVTAMGCSDLSSLTTAAWPISSRSRVARLLSTDGTSAAARQLSSLASLNAMPCSLTICICSSPRNSRSAKMSSPSSSSP
mmetsp:Transcript_48449/g.109152  ORF Transcript_48449/g.109152 Transcript_48449/m.109152 type:complete len:250 (+) Transcript_48449:1170-1919(+)